MTKDLLRDVRDVVRTTRQKDRVDLGRVLQPLTQDIPRPKIHLTVPESFEVSDPDRAHALVYGAVQEIVTNSVKHAEAENLWVDFLNTERGVEVRARDGVEELEAGNGLRGMRERLEKLGGSLRGESPPEHGFQLSAGCAARGHAVMR